MEPTKLNDSNPLTNSIKEKPDMYQIAVSEVLRNQLMNNEISYECKYCYKQYFSLRSFQEHERTHSGDRPYICVLCGMTFRQATILRSHTNYHVSSDDLVRDLYPCGVCGEHLHTERAITEHISHFHATELPIECDLCTARFTSKIYLACHRKSFHSNGKNIACSICSKKFSNRSHQIKHMNKHTTDTLFKCGECQKKYTRKYDLESHILKKHSKHKIHPDRDKIIEDKPESIVKHENEIKDDELINPSDRIETTDVRIKEELNIAANPTEQNIQFINVDEIKNEFVEARNDVVKEETEQSVGLLTNERTTNRRQRLDVHEDTSVKEQQELSLNLDCNNGDLNKQSDIEPLPIETSIPVPVKRPKRIRIRKPKLYKCQLCDKFFSGKSNARDHENLHTGEKPYQCNDCGMSFAYACSLNRHRKVHATVRIQKTFQCDICRKNVHSRDSLIEHMRLHSTELRYACDQCDARLLTSRRLYLHRKLIHKTGQPITRYKCKYCEKSYTGWSAAKDHENIHTGEKPYLCNDCGMSFIYGSQFRNHLKLHSGDDREIRIRKLNKCDLCGRSLCSKNSLNEHMRLHSKEHSFSCDVCDNRFKSTGQLNYHKKTFHGVNEGKVIRKPFTHFCSVCDRKYRSIVALNFHVKEKHG